MIIASSSNYTTQYGNRTIYWTDEDIFTCVAQATIDVSHFSCVAPSYIQVEDTLCSEATTIDFQESTCHPTATTGTVNIISFKNSNATRD